MEKHRQKATLALLKPDVASEAIYQEEISISSPDRCVPTRQLSALCLLVTFPEISHSASWAARKTACLTSMPVSGARKPRAM
ncbi:hypothetical protein AAFF_G00398860 [Aldrovandia affinis]|uniref:Uncharacterized protein n=1 Tax=Aldrovandia affinis TaxID=143900 RepID=A0AAD7SD64_9TELE|nr:hypothetical protein AAFF_G00398860 [Aldrovandia affinis]